MPKSFAITLTSSDGFTLEQIDSIRSWFHKTCDTCLVTVEQHKSGKLHLHAAANFEIKQANAVVRRFVTLYSHLNIPYQKGVSVVVKAVSDRTGWFHYLSKDVPTGEKPLLCLGYKWGDIQEECRLAVKKIPNRMIKGDDFTMNMVTAPNRILSYAKALGHPISGKESFAEIIALMAEDGYQMHNLKFKVLFAQVMAKTGDRSVMKELVLSELQWL